MSTTLNQRYYTESEIRAMGPTVELAKYEEHEGCETYSRIHNADQLLRDEEGRFISMYVKGRVSKGESWVSGNLLVMAQPKFQVAKNIRVRYAITATDLMQMELDIIADKYIKTDLAKTESACKMICKGLQKLQDVAAKQRAQDNRYR